MTDVGGRHQYLGGTIQEHDKHLPQYGFDSLIISGSYGGHRRHRRHTTDDSRRMTDNARGIA